MAAILELLGHMFIWIMAMPFVLLGMALIVFVIVTVALVPFGIFITLVDYFTSGKRAKGDK